MLSRKYLNFPYERLFEAIFHSCPWRRCCWQISQVVVAIHPEHVSTGKSSFNPCARKGAEYEEPIATMWLRQFYSRKSKVSILFRMLEYAKEIFRDQKMLGQKHHTWIDKYKAPNIKVIAKLCYSAWLQILTYLELRNSKG